MKLNPERHALTELVAQFRARAETARRMSSEYSEYSTDKYRTLGKASAYADAANELERLIRELTADPEPRTR